MRAFMSEVGARAKTDGPRRTFGGDLWGEMAECEARRILAETEPALGGTDHTRIGDFDGSYLAEALAAFVAEED